MKKYITTKEACEKLGVHPNTLRRWEKDGKVKAIRTPGNTRLYEVNILEENTGNKIIYARVSSNDQKEDLQNQIKYLRSRFPEHELIQDIGSGLNFKRKGFISLLERIMSRDIQEVVVSHRDRLCRFGFELFEFIANRFGTNLVVLNDTSLSPQEEMVRDLISIIHTFSSRIHGFRKYNDQIKKDKDLPQQGE
jgi:excisionase family DNA binding protein